MHLPEFGLSKFTASIAAGIVSWLLQCCWYVQGQQIPWEAPVSKLAQAKYTATSSSLNWWPSWAIAEPICWATATLYGLGLQVHFFLPEQATKQVCQCQCTTCPNPEAECWPRHSGSWWCSGLDWAWAWWGLSHDPTWAQGLRWMKSWSWYWAWIHKRLAFWVNSICTGSMSLIGSTWIPLIRTLVTVHELTTLDSIEY